MSKTPNPNLPFSGRRNPFPATPYVLTPSPLTTPSRSKSQTQGTSQSLANRVVAPNPDEEESTREEIWKSIETLVRAQTDILQAQTDIIQAQTAKLLKAMHSISTKLDAVGAEKRSESRDVIQGIDEVKALVRMKQEKGYRFPRYIDFERVMSMGWMDQDQDQDREVYVPFNQAHATLEGSVPVPQAVIDIDIDVNDGHSIPPLRLDEIIDMNQFEKHHDGTIPEDSNAPTLRHSVNNHTGISSTAGTGELSRHNLAKLDDSNKQNLAVSTHADDRESNLSDIFGGINDYLERPNRRRYISDSDSETPSPPPPPPRQSEGRLRRRTKRPIYSTKWHPMDKPRKYLRLEEEREAAADAANEEIRSVRGLSTARVVILPKSDGIEKMGGREWWKWGENTLKGRMVCHTRYHKLVKADGLGRDKFVAEVHWACAGLSSHDDMTTEAWACPDCLYIINRNHKKTPQPAHAQQDRCIRPNCIVRRPLTKKKGDDSRHFVERIIGRRVIARRANGSKLFEYLCKWENWEMYECTWQSPKSFDGDGGVIQLETIFLAQCAKEGVNAQGKVALLQECEGFWDENGDLKRELLEELGIPEAEWWPDPKGNYKVRHA